MKRLFTVITTLACVGSLHADPRITSWYTARSGKYARIYQSVMDEGMGASLTTWSRGAGTQSLPTYSGVNEVLYSNDWVYIRTTGLASHLMGPWYLDASKTQNFPNFPSNTATIYRIPRAPVVDTGKTNTSNGAIGYFVNGVAFFDNRDAFSYSTSHNADATPMTMFQGDGIWNRDAYPNELITFDAALAHQAGKQYHYHVQPIALRYQLGDHVDYNAGTNRYSEGTSTSLAHSPIVAWAADGYPVYGPYGYGTADSSTSAIRRIVSGYVLRDGQNNTTNLNTTGRHTLPLWAAIAQNRSQTLLSTQYGPPVNATYLLGHYIEDYDYLGDLGFVQGSTMNPGGVFFDLDRYNGRTCVTPESSLQSYAYFSTLSSDNSPAFPYNIGRQFYGRVQGGTVASISEAVTIYFHGGPSKTETLNAPSINHSTGDVTVVWSAVEGGSYKVENSSDLTTWTAFTPNTTATSDSGQKVDTGAFSNLKRFYRITRAALASFDSAGFDYP